MPDQTSRDPSIALADLALAPGLPPTTLEEARRALAIAQLTGQQGNFAVRPFAGTPPEADAATRQAVTAFMHALGPTRPAAQRVVRRDFPTPMSPDPRIGAVSGGGQAPSSTLGPFLDSLGRPILIDVFDVPVRVGIQRAGSPHPFLFVELPPPQGSGSVLTLGPGSLWISAATLTSGVPANSWIGLRIKSGTVDFGTTLPLGTQPIVVPANTTIALSLTLDPAAASAGSGPGTDARAAIAQVPAHVTLTFGATSSLTAADNATLTAFGTSIALTSQAQPAHYDPVFGRVDFPFGASPTNFTVAQSYSTLAIFSGQAAIFGAAWSLPISLGDPTSLGAAAGAGGLALGLLPNLSVHWSGHDAPAACGPCVLLVEPGLLAVGGFTASAPGAAQVIDLQNHSNLRLSTTAPFAFRYTSAAIGAESWAFLPQLVAQFDEPRTVNNARVRLAGPALIVLLQTGRARSCLWKRSRYHRPRPQSSPSA